MDAAVRSSSRGISTPRASTQAQPGRRATVLPRLAAQNPPVAGPVGAVRCAFCALQASHLRRSTAHDRDVRAVPVSGVHGFKAQYSKRHLSNGGWAGRSLVCRPTSVRLRERRPSVPRVWIPQASASSSSGTVATSSPSDDGDSTGPEPPHGIGRTDRDKDGGQRQHAPQTPPPESSPALTTVSAGLARNTVARLVRYMAVVARSERFIARRLALAILCMFASKLLGVAVPLLFKRAFDLLGQAASNPTLAIGAIPTLTNIATAWKTSQTIRWAVLAFVAHGLARTMTALTNELRTGIFAKAGQRIGRSVTALSFAHLHSLEADFHASSRTGALTRVIDRGTRSVLTIFRSVVFAFTPSLFELALVCGVLITRYSWQVVAVLLVTFVLYVTWTVAMNNVLTNVRNQMNLADNEGSAKITDSLINSEVVAMFNAADHELARFDDSLAQYEHLAVKNEWLFLWQNIIQATIFTAGLTTILVLAALRVGVGAMTVGDVIMVATLLQQMWVPLNFIGWQYRETKQALVDLANLFTVLDREPAIQDREGAPALAVAAGEIRFENVSFAYPDVPNTLDFLRKTNNGAASKTADEDDPAKELEPRKRSVRNLSFTAKPGETVALVGPSGSGKSSVLRLLNRTYDISEGRILIDGQDVAKVTLSSLREAICIVPQDTVLFNDTIMYNIRYGRLSATDAEVVEAAKAAAIHDTIMRMPMQYDTLVGERGTRMSGGERQRIATARAFLKDSQILVQDEATSALDSKTEAEVTAALDSLGQNRTRIVVAHRLSTVRDADLILVMRRGKLIEQGSHADLLAIPGGVYADMWRRQSSTSPAREPADAGSS